MAKPGKGVAVYRPRSIGKILCFLIKKPLNKHLSEVGICFYR